MTTPFPGYTTLGFLGFGVDAYDTERHEIVLLETETGRILLLTATGCACCSNALDDLDPAYAEPTLLPELSTYLWELWSDLDDWSAEGRTELEKEIRECLQKVQASSRTRPARLALP